MNRLKKKKGSTMISTLIFSFLMLIIVMTILIGFAELSKGTVASAKLDYISNNYILKLETFGYLSSTDLLNLKQELEDGGFEDIVFGSTTTTKQPYSTRIKLEIHCKYYTHFYYAGKTEEEKDFVEIDFERYTISKS